MKQTFLLLTLAGLLSCGAKKETPASIAKHWCELNGKAYKAEGAAREAAEKAVKDYENEIEAKYKNDEAFMKQVEQEVEKCEAASEGRN